MEAAKVGLLYSFWWACTYIWWHISDLVFVLGRWKGWSGMCVAVDWTYLLLLMPMCSLGTEDLARNEEFKKKIAVIKKNYCSQKQTQLSVGGFCGGNVEINHANQQFNTCFLTCKQTTIYMTATVILTLISILINFTNSFQRPNFSNKRINCDIIYHLNNLKFCQAELFVLL